MNIFMVHPHDLFSKNEPWTIRIKSIAEKFIKKGHKVRICYFPLTIGGKHCSSIWNSIELIPLDRVLSPKNFILNIIKLIKICKWADIVHFQKCHHYASIPTVIAAYVTGKPLHYDWDDWEEKIWYESCGKKINARFIGVSFKILERWLPALSDSISCASDNLKKIALRFGVKKDYIFDSPVGADLEKFRPGLDASWVKEKYNIIGEVILYIGQLHGAQYVDLFIKAAKNILCDYPDVTFMIVGEGFLEHKLKKLVSNLGVDDKVIFVGGVKHEDIPYYIAASDICVACFEDTQVTRSKSPLKIAEYLASGKPIVASLVGEVRKMAGGVGVLVKPGDYYSLSEGILKLLSNEKLKKRLSRRARIRSEKKYNWLYTADSLLSAYIKITR